MRQYQRSKVPPKPEKLKPPVNGMAVHPLVHRIWVEMNHQCASQEDIAKRSGVSSSAMRKWRKGERSPRLSEIEAVINALGYKIVIRPLE